MPIPVACAACGAKLTAPDAAAGKKVKCRQCQAVIAVPMADAEFEVVDDDDGFEVVEDTPAKAVPKRSAVVRDDDEEDDDRPRKKKTARVVDDDEEDDDRPRKKKGKAAAKSLTPLLMLLLGGGLLVLAVGGVGVYFLTRKTTEPTNVAAGTPAGKTAPVAGPVWARLDDPDGKFTAHFPNGPASETDLAGLVQAQGGNPAMAANLDKMLATAGIKMRMWNRAVGGRTFLLQAMTFPPAAAAELNGPNGLTNVVAGVKNSAGQQGSVVTGERDTAIGGRPAKVLTTTQAAANKVSVTAVLLAGGRVYSLIVIGDNTLTADDAQVRDYFAQFEAK